MDCGRRNSERIQGFCVQPGPEKTKYLGRNGPGKLRPRESRLPRRCTSRRDIPSLPNLRATATAAAAAAADNMSQEDDALREVCLSHTHAEGNANCMGGTETQSLALVLHRQDRRRRNLAIEHQCNTTIHWRSDGNGVVADWYSSLNNIPQNSSALMWRSRERSYRPRDLFETRGKNDGDDR
jgi:hypothetical protein